MLKYPRSHMARMCWTWECSGQPCMRSAKFFQMLSVFFYATTPIGWSEIWKYGKITDFTFLFGGRKHVLPQTWDALSWCEENTEWARASYTNFTSCHSWFHPMPLGNSALRVRKEWWWERNQHILILCMSPCFN